MRKASIVAVFTLVILLGLAYASWQEKATITASAQTGYIDLDFVNGRWTLTARGVIHEAYTEGSAPGNDGEPKLYLTLKNLYPGARSTYVVYLTNDGTLPVRVYNCNFTSIGGGFEFNDVDFGFDDDVDFGFEIQIDVDAFREGFGPPFVLQPGKSAYVVIYVRAKDNASEGFEVSAVFRCKYTLATS